MKKSAATELVEIGMLAPWVVARRLMAFADTSPAKRRRNAKEATRMTVEKSAAAAEALTGACVAAARVQLGLWSAWATAWAPSNAALFRALAADIPAHALRPVRRRVAANAKRLARRR